MLTPPSSVIQEIHKLHGDGCLLWLAAVAEYDIYLARSLTDVTWNSQVYSKSWFEIDGINESGDSHSPDLYVHFNNIGGVIEQIVIDNNNFSKAWVDLYLLNSNLLSETDSIYHVRAQVQKVAVNRRTVSIKIGLNNPLLMMFPSWKFHSSICQYPVFPGDTRCGYTGDATTCDRTFDNCKARLGDYAQERFGAQFGLLEEIVEEDE